MRGREGGVRILALVKSTLLQDSTLAFLAGRDSVVHIQATHEKRRWRAQRAKRLCPLCCNAPPSRSNGKLDAYEMSVLLRHVLPELAPLELHYVLSYLHAMDVNGDGELSFEELMGILRAVEASWKGRGKFRRGFAASSRRALGPAARGARAWEHSKYHGDGTAAFADLAFGAC